MSRRAGAAPRMAFLLLFVAPLVAAVLPARADGPTPALLMTDDAGAVTILDAAASGARPAWLPRDAVPVALFTGRDGVALLLARTPAGPFLAAPESSDLATLEDVDWRMSNRHDGALARRLYPSALRSERGAPFRLPLSVPGPARARFDAEGIYLPGSAEGGVTALAEHMDRTDAAARFGPPRGGRYRVGAGIFFHDAASPDPRPGFGELGCLTVRLIAVRPAALILVTAPGGPLRPPGIAPLGETAEYRVATFRAGADGDLTGDNGVTAGPPLADRVFAALSPDGVARAVLVRPLDGRMRFIESRPDGTLLAGPLDPDGPGAFPLIPVDLPPGSPEVPAAAHPARDGRIYLFPSTDYRAADTPDGRGVALVRLERGGTVIAVRHAGGDFPDEPWRRVALPVEALDALPDGAGGIYLLHRVPAPSPERLDALLDALPGDPVAALAELSGEVSVEPGPVERDGALHRQEIAIRVRRTLAVARVPLSPLLSVATVLPDAEPPRPFPDPAPYALARLDAGTDLFVRTRVAATAGMADARYPLPAQRVAAPAPSAARHRLGAPVSPPPRTVSPAAAALAAMDGTPRRDGPLLLPADRPLRFLAENPPAFDPDGRNIRSFPWDVDGDGRAAALPPDVVEGSVVWRYRLIALGGAERLMRAEDRVHEDRPRGRLFDPSARTLDLPGFGRDLARSATPTLHPELFEAGPLPRGRYRLDLTLGYDVRDGRGRRAAAPLHASLEFETE